ncbi:hypothetical protein O6H91_14G020100 [Diphasiastrum complanatum]|nr:hypothetical protein O6H91_14G020100 [Diphasiastrum complanatum]
MRARGEQTTDYLRYISEGSSNVALDGNFSIQVVEKALGALDLKCVSLEAPEAEEARAAPHNQNAFICNLQEHWFAIRKVSNEWYNFNSLYAAPEHLSNFYLSAYLDSLKENGWSIFVVVGELPNASLLRNSDSDSRFGRWLTPQQASALLESANEAEQRADPSLEAALAASLADYSGFPQSPGFSDQDSSELAAALAASLADVRPPLKE